MAWTPPIDGRFGLAKKAADAGVAAARERLASDRAQLRQELRRVFAEWSLSSERRELLAVQAELVGRLAESERQRARVGEAAGLSARRLYLAKAEVQAALREAEADLARAEAVAHAWRPGLAPGVQVMPAISPEPPADAPGADSPELRSLARDIERAGLEARRARRFWGFPTLQFGWQRLENSGVVLDGPLFAANWSVPLFDRDKAARIEAEKRGEATKARLDLARARLAAEVNGGLAAYRLLFTSAREARQAAAIAAACLCWALDNNLTQRVSGGDPVQVAAIKGGVSSAVNLAVAAVLGVPWPSPALVVSSLVVGFLGYGVSLSLFVVALRHVGTARTGAYFSVAPFVGALASLVLLAEPARPALALAALLMGAGVWLHLTERHEHDHRHERLVHAHRHAHDDHHQHAHGPAHPEGEPHTHEHVHEPLIHRHPHYPDIHHRHPHGGN